jgi:hypothetical protein
MKILHCFADHGTEAEALGRYGDVIRVGIDIRDTNTSTPIQADAHALPFDGEPFDLGLFHPPCTKWSDMPSADQEAAPNLIPLARELAAEYCAEWIIENKPRAPLEDATVLTGKMFGLPIEYARAFETSFDVDQPPRQASVVETETSGYYYSEKSRAWWASVKGIDAEAYTKRALAKNALPAAYVDHLLRSYLEATGRADGPSDYTDYDKKKDAERAREANHELAAYADGGSSTDNPTKTDG